MTLYRELLKKQLPLPEITLVATSKPCETCVCVGGVDKCLFTVFTSVYNREKTIRRVYESIASQTLLDSVEWILIDDGSTDSSLEIMKDFVKEAKFPIRLFHQKNSGLNVAWNHMLKLAKGELLISIDSDDALRSDALEIALGHWNSLDEMTKKEIKGIAFPVIDPDTGLVPGVKPENYPLKCSDLDYRLKYRYTGENIGVNRLDLLREFPFLVLKGMSKFCPESIIWYEMARSYPMIYYPEPIRFYYSDSGNRLTGKKTNRAPSNYFLWRYYVNCLDDYFFSAPKTLLKGYVGMCRDGILTGRSLSTILSDAGKWYQKLFLLCSYPLGWILAKKG